MEPLPPLRELFFVGNKLLCERSVYWFRTNGDAPARVASTAFLCPRCGEVWARRAIICTQPNHPQIEDRFDWVSRSAFCPRHGGGSLVVTDSEFEQMLIPYYDSHYPLAWMQYELEVQLRSFS